MPVNPFGPFTIDEELQMRAEVLASQVVHEYEEIKKAQDSETQHRLRAEELESLHDEYVEVHMRNGRNDDARKQFWTEHESEFQKRIKWAIAGESHG